MPIDTHTPIEPEPSGLPESTSVPPASRDDDGTDQPPPVSIPGKGPMDQSVPDVAVGSTPVTRRDD